MNLTVAATEHAAAQIEEIDTWWHRYRTAAPTLFLDEVENACELLSRLPRVGLRVRHPHIAELRRLYLPRSRYHLYYVHESAQVVVLAVWSAHRGSEPEVVA